MKRLCSLTVLLLLAAPVLAGAGLPTGKGEYDFVWNGKTVPVWTYRPAAAGADAPVIFVCHGAARDGENYRDSWVTQAEAKACIVIAPEFTDTAFPGSSGYNLGNMVTSGGAARPQSDWAFDVIESVFDDVRAKLGPAARTTYLLYGHSAGSQFVQRMLLYAPQLRAERAVMANAGWYTVPELTTPFPYGLQGSNYSLPLLRERLAQPFVVLLGQADTDPNDPELNHTAGADAQGSTRLARGEYFYAHAEAAAPSLPADFAWQLGYAPGIGHSTAAMTPYAAAWLFSASPTVPPPDPATDPDSPEITLTHLGYDESFNHAYTTSPTPTALPWVDGNTIPGWFLQLNAIGTPGDVTTQATLASTTAGPVYVISQVDAPGNFLVGTRVTDANGSPAGTSGSGYYLGLRLTNHTGGIITQFALSYTGAQFYRSLGTSSSTIEVAYRTAAGGAPVALTSGGWQDLPALTFTSPTNGAGQSSAATVDFNMSGNFTDFAPAIVSGIAWADGDDLWLRWRMPNVPGTDQGIGIDNVSFAAAAPLLPPAIITAPQAAKVVAGAAVTLTATATGGGTLAYQWLHDGVAVAGATKDTLVLAAVQGADTGSYAVVVSNPAGSVTSAAAEVTLGASWIANLSIRAMAGTADEVLIAGFVVTGGSKDVLVQSPTLTGYGVAGALVDPQLALFAGGTVVGQNDDWESSSNAADVAAVVVRLGATSLPAGGKDAALLALLPAGVYTAQVSGKAATAGVAISAVFDAGGGGRLANVSGRCWVGRDDAIVIGGFVIGGDLPKAMLLRAIGPTLDEYGVAGALANPQLEVFAGADVVAANDDWSANAAAADAVVAASVRLGAFPLESGTRDAALLVTLAPGVYTVQVSGVAGSTGVALIEIYDAQ